VGEVNKSKKKRGRGRKENSCPRGGRGKWGAKKGERRNLKRGGELKNENAPAGGKKKRELGAEWEGKEDRKTWADTNEKGADYRT